MADTTELSKILGDTFAAIPYRVLKAKCLTPADKLVYTALLSHLGNNLSVWPGHRTLITETGLSKGSIEDSIEQLERAKLISVDRSQTIRQSNIYIFAGPEWIEPDKLSKRPTPQDSAEPVSALGSRARALTSRTTEPPQGVGHPALTSRALPPQGVGHPALTSRAELNQELNQGTKKVKLNTPQSVLAKQANRAATNTLTPAPTQTQQSIPNTMSKPTLSDQIRTIISISEKKGVEVPSDKKYIVQSLAQIIKTEPTLRWIWPNIIHHAMSKDKLVMPKKLEWLVKFTTTPQGTRLFNYQKVAQWMYEEDNTTFNRALERYRFDNNIVFDLKVAYDTLDRIMGAPSYRPPLAVPDPFYGSKMLRTFIGFEPRTRFGAKCKIISQVGNQAVVAFNDDSEPLTVLLSELGASDCQLPPLPAPTHGAAAAVDLLESLMKE